MKPFRYGLDSLCLLGCVAYAVNRWVLKPWWGGVFLKGYFNDLWLIPAGLPWVLGLHRLLRLRGHDLMPTWGEIFLHLVLWSVLFEGIGPHYLKVSGDGWDVMAYVLGGLGAGLWWNRASAFRPCQPKESVFSETL